jgi:hypothetical protein
MATAERTNPQLWKRIQTKWKNSDKGGKAGQWNARKAQLAVQEYKRRGGTYVGPKQRRNSLVKWTKEDWGYIDNKAGNRYLPRVVREKLSPAEKRVTNMQKKKATASGKQYAPYSPAVLRKMRQAKII